MKYKALDFYLERRKTRQYVGRLSRKRGKFVFEYNTAYLYSENPVSIGPDLPLKKARHISLTLFPSFADRIPSRKNPAYEEYCHDVGLSPFEKDTLVLLSAFGKKSPITPFVCEPVREQKECSAEELRSFRKSLGLSIREFALLFDMSQASIYRTENNKTTGRDILKKLAVFIKYPKMALHKVQNNPSLNEFKRKRAENFLRSKIQISYSAVGPFTVTPEDVQKCRPKQAVELLKRLILSECAYFNIPQNNLNISSKISTPDGGQDALIKWNQEEPKRTNFFPKKYNVFQVKAQKVSPNECVKEISSKNKKIQPKNQAVQKSKKQVKENHGLNPAVQNVMKNKGAYILFSTYPVAGAYLQSREEAMQKFIEKAGYDLSSVEIKFYSANEIVNWLNSFPSLAVWFLKEVCGKALSPWISWQDWSKDIDHRSEFMSHAELEKKKLALFNYLSHPQQTAHLTGPSGVGKTRLALESFRPPKEEDHDRAFEQKIHTNDISALVLYSPAHLITEAHIRELKNSRAILVVDDCSIEKAERFHKLALQKDSQLSFLTIGLEKLGGIFTHILSTVPDSHALRNINNSHIFDLGLHSKKSLQPQEFQNLSNFNQIYVQKNKGLLVELGLDTKIVTKILSDRQDISNISIEPLYIKMTEGFPLMAQLLKKAGPIDLIKDDPPLTVRKKMLWGLEEADPQAEKVIKVLSLFDTICITDDPNQKFIIYDTSVRRTKEEIYYVAEHIAKMDYDEFYKKIKFFEKRQIIQTHSRFLQVRPKPLALWLAMELIHETPPESIIKWLSDMDQISKNMEQQKVKSDKKKYQQLSKEEQKEYKKQQEADKKRYANMSDQEKKELKQWTAEIAPHQALRKSFCKQIHYLTAFSEGNQPAQDINPETQILTRQLCKPQGFFGQEKVLNTGWGASSVNNLTKLAPKEVLNSLEKVINKKTIKELLNMKVFSGMPSVRREWIGILQKLAFKKEFFLRVAKLLLKLVEAENENYSNNATGIFIAYFQLMLSGTQANPEIKFQLIKEIKREGTDKQKEIAVQALEKALPQQLGYTGNYDGQVINPYKNWRPATDDEEWNYHRTALKHLTEFATNSDLNEKTRKKAEDIIADYLPSLLQIKTLHEDIQKTVKQVMAFLPDGFWLLAIKNIEQFLQDRSHKETIKKTKEILKLLQSAKQDINKRICLYVTKSDDYQIYDPQKPNKGYSLAFTKLIDDFIQYIQTAKSENIIATLEVLFHGPQNQTMTFAKETAKKLNTGLIDILLRQIKKWQNHKDFNSSFLTGFISGLNVKEPEKTQKILDKIAHNAEYKRFVLPAYYSIDLCDQDITRLIQFLTQLSQTVDIPNLFWYLDHLSTAQKCQNVSPNKMKELIIFLTNKNKDVKWVKSALNIYSYYVHSDDKKEKQLLSDVCQKLLTQKKLFKTHSSSNKIRNDYTDSDYSYKLLVSKLFSLSDEKLFSVLAQDFSKFFVSTIFYYKGSLLHLPLSEECIKECLKTILEKYPDTVLSEIAKNKDRDKFNTQLLSKHSNLNLYKKSLFSLVCDDEILKKWCKKAPSAIPAFLAENTDLLNYDKEKKSCDWSSLAYFLFDNYGDQKKITDAVSTNLGNTGVAVWGSFLNYYENIKTAMMNLRNHKHKNIKDFCENQISYLQDRIKQLEQQEQERKELDLF